MTLQLIRSRLGQLLGGLAALMLLVGVAGQAQADACTDANPVATLVTIGKGQSPSNNPKVSHSIVGNIVDPAGRLNNKSSRIPVCSGSGVAIAISDLTGGLSVTPGGTLSCSASGGSGSCSGIISQTEKYIARSGDGKDTDRMTLLAK